MTEISLVATASYLPETVIPNDWFDAPGARASSGMFKGSRERRHMAPGETGAQMIERASLNLAAKVGKEALANVDMLLTNVSLPDSPFLGCGLTVARALGAKPKWILDLHNTGCVAFVYMLALAKELMASGAAKTALLCCAQTAAGRVFNHPENRVRAQSAVPGDGCGVGFVVAGGESPVRGIVQRSFGEYADDMRAACDNGASYWDPHRPALYLDFTERRVAAIVSRANQLVPGVLKDACKAAEVPTKELDVLVTNQPNAFFLRNWREAVGVSKEAHVDSFEEYGNLFGAAIPINLERAEKAGRLGKGKKVALGGFSHAGDYAAAAVWFPS